MYVFILFHVRKFRAYLGHTMDSWTLCFWFLVFGFTFFFFVFLFDLSSGEIKTEPKKATTADDDP